MPNFQNTADRVVRLSDMLLSTVRARHRHRQIPSILELQTICRETGCRLPELESFSQALDSKPGLLILGGSASFAKSIASVFEMDLDPPALPEIPIAWMLESGRHERVRIRYGQSDHDVSPATLTAFLTSDLKVDDLVLIDQSIQSDSDWKIIWVPYPGLLESVIDRLGTVGLFLAHQAVVCVSDVVPESVMRIVHAHAQKFWAMPSAETEFADALIRLVDELRSLLAEPEEERSMRRVQQWQWLALRLRAQIEDRKKSYTVLLDRNGGHLKNCRHVLQQYRKSWAGSLHNLLDDYFQSRLTGSGLTALAESQKDGPRPETFMTATGFNNLRGKLDAFITDRMVEFVSGLGALASKLELMRISLGDSYVKWDSRALSQLCEAQLEEKKVFPPVQKKKTGLVRNLTQRAGGLSDERKAQLQRAARVVVQTIETDFAGWSESLMRSVEQTVRVQLAAALANSGHPDPEGIELAMIGLDRVARSISGKDADAQSEDAVLAECFQSLAANLHLARYRLTG